MRLIRLSVVGGDMGLSFQGRARRILALVVGALMLVGQIIALTDGGTVRRTRVALELVLMGIGLAIQPRPKPAPKIDRNADHRRGCTCAETARALPGKW